ncbi:8-oxo-dGTP diphosphatase [Formivibrio citricus]|uniref:8-oxo-dGTP diphosphatase n=1 Tax=Formivibrio citricus TaxID=83765 RepID=A0A1I4WHL7_9NEIS|nr:Nudix family hydrolase [Formivibrio citricus]SFN12752.1 8-oxo-dGTP diphosphatase [Formivibrio citricus]
MKKIVDVAAGVLLQKDGSFLLASRPADKVYAGYWEFPGGKLEQGESAFDALERELHEEMGIHVTAATPWIVQTFTYPHATVRLHFFRVTGWEGELHPHEGQTFAWQRTGKLNESPILPANGPILRGLAQVPVLAFSNVGELGEAEFLRCLQSRLESAPLRLVLREPQLDRAEYRRLASAVLALVRDHGGSILLHGDIDLARELGADGVHLPTRMLASLDERPRGLDWVGASAHHAQELEHIARLGLDYAVLGHVAPTRSHPGTPPLGWKKFAELVAQGWPMPVYAIGGMRLDDLAHAQQCGAHGIAMLRAYWENA